MRSLAFLVLSLVLVGTSARAAEVSAPPASCFANAERWSYDREKETLAAPGERFLDDMQRCAPSFAAAVVEAVRYQIQKDETDKFVHQQGFVVGAYGVAWALLAVGALAVWLRQRRLAAELRALEQRLAAAGAEK
jgi:hypothetical protein